MRSWGYVYVSIAFVWIKLNPKALTPYFGMGQWTRSGAEFVIMGKHGQPKRQSKSVSQIVMSPIGKHSAKPHKVRELIFVLMGDLPRIELFAREKAEGWDVWGNEVESNVNLIPNGVGNCEQTALGV